MSDYPVFQNAPITEAILDIQVKLSEEITIQNLERMHSLIKDQFPEKGTRISLKAEFSISSPPPTSVPTIGGPIGHMFKSSSEGKIVQARLDGFSFSKLKPYQKWSALRDEAHELWKLYLEIAKPVTVTRISLRYINRIEIPLPMHNFNEYILMIPEVAPTLPQGLAHFFMRLVIPFPETQITAIITQTLGKKTNQSILPLIFDIDVLQNVSYESTAEDIWILFEKIRDTKNKIFFESLTTKAKELFK